MTLNFRRRTVLTSAPFRPLVQTAALIVACLFAAKFAYSQAPAPAKADAERLVAAAAQAEIAGDSIGSVSLLNEAVRMDPDNKAARWQLGQVQVGGVWIAAEEAQRRAAADPTQTEYRQRKAVAGNNLAEQLTLARWCRKNKLDSEAEFHWSTVLALDPTNSEALKALDLRWKDGRLVSRNQMAAQKQQAQTAKVASEYWQPIIAKWRRAVAGRDVPAHDGALKDIGAITRTDSIPSIEAATLGRDAYDVDHAEECLQIAVAFLTALDKMPEQVATESIVRHAVLSPGNKARNLAMGILKQRPPTDYVPLLLSGLAMPLESSFEVKSNPDGSVFYTHSLYREGQDSDWACDLRLSAIQNYLGGQHITYDVKSKTVEVREIDSSKATEFARRNSIASRYISRYGKAAVETEAKIAQINESIEFLNALVMQVLTGTTGKTLETPKAWWDWWRDVNEYYASEEHPVDRHYYSGTDKYNYGEPLVDVRYPEPPPPRPGRLSCFAKGTTVWTKTGQRSIESITLGDLVLAQNVDTGELNYKPVVAITVRPPSAMLRIKLDKEQITGTLGHPFWVAGCGWRMAKELGDNAKLHCIGGASQIRSIETAPNEEAYNLVIADFNTYFVGNSGVLVHDNTPRRSTLAVLPGLAKQ